MTFINKNFSSHVKWIETYLNTIEVHERKQSTQQRYNFIRLKRAHYTLPHYCRISNIFQSRCWVVNCVSISISISFFFFILSNWFFFLQRCLSAVCSAFISFTWNTRLYLKPVKMTNVMAILCIWPWSIAFFPFHYNYTFGFDCAYARRYAL